MVLSFIGLHFFWVNLILLSILSQVILCIVGIVLNGSNAIGYYKCNKAHEKKLKGFVAGKAIGAFTGALFN